MERAPFYAGDLMSLDDVTRLACAAWGADTMKADMDAERKLLDECFSKPDHEFGSRPVQIDATLDWVRHLRDHQVGWKNAKGQIERYLEELGMKKGDARRQIERAKVLVRPWLI